MSSGDGIEGVQDLQLDFHGDITSPAGFGHHFVGQLFFGGSDDLMVSQLEEIKDSSQWLFAVFAGDFGGILFHVGASAQIIPGVGIVFFCDQFLDMVLEFLIWLEWSQRDIHDGGQAVFQAFGDFCFRAWEWSAEV